MGLTGQEDESWGTALETLHGPPWRPIDHAPLWHLFHPPQQRASRRWGSLEHRALYRRYQQAKDDPEAMRALLAETEAP